MSLKQLVTNFWKVKAGFIYVYALNTLLLIILMFVAFDYKEWVYPLVLSSFLLLIYLLFTAIKFWSFCRLLEDAKESPLISLNPLKIEDQLIFDTTNEIHKQYHSRLFKVNSNFKERNALFSQWIHNMKVSIAVIELATEKGMNEQPDADYIRDIKAENEKLKGNLEESLNILRLDEFSRDYIPEKISLQRLVLDTVNGQKRDFIYQGVFPKVQIDEDLQVWTDPKWCKYLIKQILSNAIKYSESQAQKTVRIQAVKKEKSIDLEIRDEGMGIAPVDLPRVFDPFFTGENGRKEDSATGIGLYMVKTISKSLGHQIAIKSVEGEGTTVIISFLSKV